MGCQETDREAGIERCLALAFVLSILPACTASGPASNEDPGGGGRPATGPMDLPLVAGSPEELVIPGPLPGRFEPDGLGAEKGREADDVGSKPGPVSKPLPVPPPGFELPDGGVDWRPTEREIERWIWLAGRPRLAGLPAARQKERDEERAMALRSLAADIEEHGRRRSLAFRHIERLFQSPRTSDELWAACARVAGSLGLYRFAEFIAVPLLAGVSGPRHLASSTALHELFGRWFVDAEELVPFLDSVDAGPDTKLLLGTLSAEEDRSRARLFALLETDPRRAVDWLADRDPCIRPRAAKILGKAFSIEGVKASELYGRLFDMLEAEIDPNAFHQALEAVVPPLELADPRSAELTRLRELLARVATSGDDARAMSAVRVLGRLPWTTSGSLDSAHILKAVGLCGEALRDLAEAERRRGSFDPDPLVSAFRALQVLSDRAVREGLAGDLRGSPARIAVISILGDDVLGSAVRSMAGSALGALALHGDADLIREVLKENATDPVVAHALLGATRELLLTFVPTMPQVRSILLAVIGLSGARDPDLRRRALQLLADESLAEHVAVLDWGFLLDRLEEEEIEDLDRMLLALLRRYGTDYLEPLIGVRRFDELARDTEGLSDLSRTLETLAAGRPHLTMLAARRLSRVENEAVKHAARRHALTMVANLSEEKLRSLTPDDHRAICTWAWQLHEAGVGLEEVMPESERFIRRLSDTHIEFAQRAEEVGDLPTAALEHLNALVEAHLYLKSGMKGAKGAIEHSFKQAYELTKESELRLLVLRDRARFRAEVGDTAGALEDFRELLRVDALHVPDVRIAIGILRSTAATGQEASLVANEIGRREPPSVRLQDLEDWGNLVLRVKNEKLVAALAAVLTDLPKSPPEDPPDATPEERAPAWSGLLRDPAHFQALTKLNERLQEELSRLAPKD